MSIYRRSNVEGQCVTGDTKVKVIPKDANFAKGLIGHGSLVIEKRITDVQMGDYALSFNEDTGQLEPHKIKGLLDMGIKPVFRLTTEDGKTIRTTGNHPYLTKDGWKKVVEIGLGEEIAVPKSEVFMPRAANDPVMDKHYKNYETKSAENTQHNNHFSSPLSTLSVKNKIIRDANNAQNIAFCKNDSLAKNSPAKYPATMIFEKSPTSLAIDSLDFGLSHFIYIIEHSTGVIACQAGILEGNAYADIAAAPLLKGESSKVEDIAAAPLLKGEGPSSFQLPAHVSSEASLRLRLTPALLHG